MDVVRRFVIETVLQGTAEAKLEKLINQAKSLTDQAFNLKVAVSTEQAEKQVQQLKKTVDQVSKMDNSKSIKSHKDQAEVVKGLTGHYKAFAEQSRQAGEMATNFFSRLDAGRLVVAGAAAGLVAYAKSATDAWASTKLQMDMMRDQLGERAGGLLSFIGQGGEQAGTSEERRAALLGYMSMTGYRDPEQMEAMTKNAEKIMSSTFGAGLEGYGIRSEKELLQALSNPMDENSDLGRIIKSKVPNYFKAGTLEAEKIRVSKEEQYTYQSDAVIEAEARRRMAAKALEQIGEGVNSDDSGYRLAARDMADTFSKLNRNIGKAVAPAAEWIMKLITVVMKLINTAPEVAVMAASVLVLGTAFATIGAIMPLVTSGFTALGASMLANPIGLVIIGLVALGIVLAGLERRTQIFSKAWDYFTKSEIGHDLIDGVTRLMSAFGIMTGMDPFGSLVGPAQFLADIVRGLFDQVDNIYKMLKSGDIKGAMLGGLKLALTLSPIGFAAVFIEALKPSKRNQERVLWVLEQVKTLWDGFTNWFRDIYGGLAKLFSPITNLYNLVKQFVEKFTGEQKELTSTEKSDLVTWVKSVKDGGGGRRYDFTEPTILAAIEQARTGKDLRPPNADERVYNDLVDALRNKLKNPTVSTEDATPRGAAAGNPFYSPEMTKAVSVPGTTLEIRTKPADQVKGSADVEGGLTMFARSAYDYVMGHKNAVGGEVQKAGLAWVDEGEPIVPAEVARSSELIDSLRAIASGGGGVGGSRPILVQINIGGVTATAPGGSDAYGFARSIRDELHALLNNDFEIERIVQEISIRANRSFIG